MVDRLKEGQVIEIEVSDLTAEARALGRYEGMVVMVSGGLPGETVEAEVTRVKRRFALAKCLRLLKKSEKRIEPRCRHFDYCGGCSWQDLGYQDQLEFKRRFVVEGLRRIGKIEDVEVEPTLPAAEQFFYRNKMEYSFGKDEDQPAAGLHRRGRYDSVFELEECLLQSEVSVKALTLIRGKARELGIDFYDEANETGELRFLVVREGKLTDELMLNLVTRHEEFDGRDELFQAVISGLPELTCFFQTVNSKRANITQGDLVVHVHGKDHLTERIGELTFRIGPFSFFQTNTVQTRTLYDLIADHAELSGTEHLLDLFCGCGSIGLYLANRVQSVLGIELNEEAIELAKHNAALNSISNADFVAGDARRLLVELHEKERAFDLIITDPPRAGLEVKAIRRLARLQPPRIVAVSCNPATLARDLATFREHGYRTTRVSPVDMFPQTTHVETVATLVREAE
jgi:23S rRNA (uracil1939-C5)-methyltransferase